jgi:hypothetical protein
MMIVISQKMIIIELAFIYMCRFVTRDEQISRLSFYFIYLFVYLFILFFIFLFWPLTW